MTRPTVAATSERMTFKRNWMGISGSVNFYAPRLS
jgi:hypothetical protein